MAILQNDWDAGNIRSKQYFPPPWKNPFVIFIEFILFSTPTDANVIIKEEPKNLKLSEYALFYSIKWLW